MPAQYARQPPPSSGDRPSNASDTAPRGAGVAPIGIGSQAAVTHELDMAPSQLQAVQGRDIAMVWDAAHGGHPAAARAATRLFRFHAPDGSVTTMTLADRDARAWAMQVDHAVGLGAPYGVALCLRLLALVDLLARSRYLSRHVRKGRADLPSALFRAAANLPLDADGRFEEAGFATLLGQAPPATGSAR